MKTPIAAALLAGLLALPCPALAADMVPGMDNVPLAPGLTAPPDAALVYDAPGGRQVEAEATGAVAVEQVRAFYAATLPQLGWTMVTPARYRREMMQLDITIQPDPMRRQTAVLFMLMPQAAP
ncbi:hypothetical protein [Chitinimonas koreensis]|uniref:hypothetical protein n=1 Tax=Chitinimonas koreensis TaxID=356302 RepID=UPI0003F75A26|nr:hypothetical protein [Chitinimonas koreensis]QNM96194.1 hypothetical protein H9L41_20675 [Chitinimonas koreensis]